MKTLHASVLFAAAALLAPAFPWAATHPAPLPAPALDDEDAEEAEEEDSDRWFAVTGGDVYTGNGAVFRGATVLSRNGVIEEIGYDLYLPEETEVLDATGYRVYPGLVALDATSRITGGGRLMGHPIDDRHVHGNPESFGEGQDAGGDPFAASAPDGDSEHGDGDDDPLQQASTRTALEDSFDPFSSYLVLTLATGITTVEQSGGAAIKLKRGEIEGVEMRSGYLSSFSYSTRNGAQKEELRQQFRDARRYLRDYREWEEKKKQDKDLKEPSDKGIKSNVLSVLRGENRAHFSSSDRTDLLAIAELAQEFGFRPVITGCTEGWTVADELGRAGAAAILTPRSRSAKPENLVRDGGSSIENAAILHRAGVQVAVRPQSTSIDLGGITGRDLMHLPIEADFAIRGGLPEQAALEAITLVPARLLGVDDRVGSLEVGKDCDLIVTDGDVLHYQTFVQYTVVHGKLVYDKQEELFFSHIRPRPEDGAGEAESDTGEDAEDGDGDSDE